MTGVSLTASWDRAAFARIADWLVVAIAASLPWSTTATSILAVVWLLALIPTLDRRSLRGELLTLAGGLPVLLFLLALAGMAWADVSLAERGKGLDPFLKLLAIPLLFVEFRRSQQGLRVFGAYLISCLVLLAATTCVEFFPQYSPVALKGDNVLVKNASNQSGEFVTCIFGILFLARELYFRKQWVWLVGAVIAVLGMLANMTFVSVGRTALLTIPALLLLFAAKKLSYRSGFFLAASAILIGAMAWSFSPYLRERTAAVWVDFRNYESTDEQNSSGERVEFYKKSLLFLCDAPIFGHGTGTIPELFRKSAIGKSGAQGSATTNPHNQTFAVAIQLGMLGVVTLWAMWISHLLLFRGTGLVEWIGLVIVVQNIVGSLLNSHLFDFGQGWVYVVGVGVTGGMMRARKQLEAIGRGGGSGHGPN